MEEPMYQITTEVSEKDFYKAVRVTCPKNSTVEFFLVGLLECFASIYLWTEYSMNIAALLIGVITFILGVIFMVKAVRMPEKYARENLHERRVVTGKDCVREEMKFFQEEILIHNLEMDKDIHIPYAYITRIYLLEDMLVFMMDQNVEEIMKRDIPEEDAFIPWFLSKCSAARIKNAM